MPGTRNDTQFPRRFVTGHDVHGNAIFLYEGEVASSHVPAIGTDEPMGMAVPWQSSNPVDLLDDTDTGNAGNGAIHVADGHTCRLAVVPPHSSSPMHRTATIDYVVLVSGELELELEGGGRRKLTAGDVIVQRGTNHTWHNTGDIPARIFAVLVSARLPVVAGQQLEPFNSSVGSQSG